MIEVHEKDQSKSHYLPDWESVGFHTTGQIIQHEIKLNIFNQISTSIHPCVENNEQKIGQCVTEFLEHKMNCSLPWDHKYHRKDHPNVCHEVNDFDRYINLTKDMKLSSRIKQELKEFGCLIPNCRNLKWEVLREFSGEFSLNESVSLMFAIQRGTKVLKKNIY
jgi:hypothetical protein